MIGEGVCFSYDAVGSFEKVKYSSSGTGHELVQSIIDSQVCKSNLISINFFIIIYH